MEAGSLMAIVASAPEITTGRPSEGGHWYGRDGSCVYEIRGANGRMRPVTLRDARKLGLVPGVSSIVSMENRPMLVRWQIEQALMAALTLPRIEGETEDAFMERAQVDSQRQAREAAERGTRIHAAIQGHFEGASCEAEFIPYVMGVVEWLAQRFGADGWEAECSFAHPLGFGGKSDLHHKTLPAVADFKCKDFPPEKQATDLAYPEHCMQIAAYANGFRMARPNCLNVFVSTRVPGLIRVREWDQEEIEEGWEAFQCLLKLWQIRRSYRCAF